ncbi:MAG: hypothetical protein ABEJ56_05530 [Candidatus Nanohaloarchaea archaeon]
MRKDKLLYIAFAVFAFTSAASAASIQVEGLTEKDINTSFTQNGVRFATDYVNKTVSYKNVTLPQKWHDDLNYFQASFQTNNQGQKVLQIRYQFLGNQKDKLLDGVKDVPDRFGQYQFEANQQINGNVSEQFQIQSQGNQGGLKDEQVQIQYQRSGFQEKVSYTFNGESRNLSFSNPDLEFGLRGGVIQPQVSSHYEHLIVRHQVYGNHSFQNKTQTTENVYSGNDTQRIPVSGKVKEISAGKVRQSITHDNLYEGRETEKLVVAHEPRSNVSGIDWNGLTHEKLGSINYSKSIQPELDQANISTGTLNNPEKYEFEVYNVTYPADSKKTIGINFTQPVYNPLTDDPEKFEFDYYSYVIGSVATFKTDTSSEWNSGSFTETVEKSGVLELTYSDGDKDIFFNKGLGRYLLYYDTGSGSVKNTSLPQTNILGLTGVSDTDEDVISYKNNSNNEGYIYNLRQGTTTNTGSGTAQPGGFGDKGDDGDLDLFMERTSLDVYDLGSGSSSSLYSSIEGVGGVDDIGSDGDIDVFTIKDSNISYYDSGSDSLTKLNDKSNSVGGIGDVGDDGDIDVVYSEQFDKDLKTYDFGSNSFTDTGVNGKPIGGVGDVGDDGDLDVVYSGPDNFLRRYDFGSSSSFNLSEKVKKVGGITDVGFGSGSYVSKVYSASEKKVWDNITVSNYNKNGGTIDIWVKTSNDGSPGSNPLETEKVSSSELSSSGTQTIDLSLSQGATDAKYNISYSKGTSTPSIDSIELDGKTANNPPTVERKEVEWTGIGGTGSKVLNLSIGDPDGQQIKDYNSANGLTVDRFTNSTFKLSGWSTPVDTFFEVNDFNGVFSNPATVNFTVKKDTGIQPDSGHGHNLSDQQTEYTVNIYNRGEAANYTLTFSDDGTVVSDGSVSSQEVASGKWLNTTEVWKSDFITGETENEVAVVGENSSRSHDFGTQYVLNRTELVVDNSKSFSFSSVDLSSRCENTVSATVSSGSNVQATGNCSTVENSVDAVSETSYDFTPAPDRVYLEENYTGFRNVEAENTRGNVNFSSVSSSGVGLGPLKCSQSNSTSKDIDAGNAVNYTTGYNCDPGGEGTPVQTILENDPTTDFNRVYFNTTFDVNSNETKTRRLVWNISEDDLKNWDSREGGSVEAIVDSKRGNVTVLDKNEYVEVVVGTDFGNSSLESGSHSASLTYYYSTGSSGGGGGGGGGGGEPSKGKNLGVKVSETRFNVRPGRVSIARFNLENLASKSNTVVVSVNSSKTGGECSRFEVAKGQLGEGFGNTGRYVLEPASNQLGSSVGPKIRVDMPGQDALSSTDGVVSCNVTVGVSAGTPPTGVVFEAVPEPGLVSELKGFLRFELGVDPSRTVLENIGRRCQLTSSGGKKCSGTGFDVSVWELLLGAGGLLSLASVFVALRRLN